MDSDDVSLPNRIGTQVQFLNNNPDYAVVGTFAKIIDEQDNIIAEFTHPVENKDITKTMLHRNCITHGSVMFRMQIIKQIGGYDNELPTAQDYDLWLRVMDTYKLYNIPEFLYRWRAHDRNITFSSNEEQQNYAICARKKYFLNKDKNFIVNYLFEIENSYENQLEEFKTNKEKLKSIEEKYDTLIEKIETLKSKKLLVLLHKIYSTLTRK
jgi:hypothetical protein